METFEAQLNKINEELEHLKQKTNYIIRPEEFNKTISDLYEFVQRTKKEKEAWHNEYISLLNNMRDFYRDQLEMIRQEQGNKQ